MSSSERESHGGLDAVSEGLAGAVEKAGAAVVAVDARPRVPTSGVHWRQGVIVSTNHTVQRDEEITVTTGGGETIPATLAGRDPTTDLAVLRIAGDAATNLAVVEAGDAGALRVGHLVVAVGRVSRRGVSAGLGMVSAAGGAWRTWRGGEVDRLLRLDLGIFLGFSGGALVNTEGRVVGINTSALSRGGAMTIPAATVNRVVDALLERGRIARGYLGVGMYPVMLPDEMRSKLNLTASSGLILLSVEAGGPAGKAGLMLGDVLVALGDTPTRHTDDVQGVLGADVVGQNVRATIIRGGSKMEIDVTVGERPPRGRCEGGKRKS